uniref:Clade I nitrous oxide reductase n=1 Tax=Macrostomum lignano TaxID=282301 RepID=A0A1I8FPH7_9PLAT
HRQGAGPSLLHSARPRRHQPSRKAVRPFAPKMDHVARRGTDEKGAATCRAPRCATGATTMVAQSQV